MLLYRAFLGLPSIGEAARRHLATLSTKKTGEILRDELISSIDSCIDQVALHACVEVLHNLTGRGKLKRELGGVDIDKHREISRSRFQRAPPSDGSHVRSCRSILPILWKDLSQYPRTCVVQR